MEDTNAYFSVPDKPYETSKSLRSKLFAILSSIM